MENDPQTRVICPMCGGPTLTQRTDPTCADGHPRCKMVPIREDGSYVNHGDQAPVFVPAPARDPLKRIRFGGRYGHGPVRPCKHCGEPTTGSWCSDHCWRAEDGGYDGDFGNPGQEDV